MAAPAKAAGKSKADINDIQSVSEIKSVIAAARRGAPASCLIGSTADDDAIIFVDKKRAPEQLMAAVQKAAGDAGITMNRQSMRFGRLSYKTSDGQDADVGDDGGDDDATGAVLHILVNKAPAGSLQQKLTRRLKEVGCSKFEIHVDGGDEGDTDAPQAAAPQALDDDAQPDTDAAVDGDAAAVPPPAPPAGPSMAQLQGSLVDMMKLLPAVIQAMPDQKVSLVQLATAASAAVKSGDTAAAGPAIDALQAAMQQAQPAAAAPAAPAAPQGAAIPAATVAKSRLIWEATRGAVEKQLAGLQSKMSEAYKDHGFGAGLEQVFKSKIDPMMMNLDTQLSDVLDNVANSADPAEQKKLMGQAQQVIGRYESYLASEPLIKQLDDNPFMPVQIEATLTKTLTALSKTIGSMAGA